MKRKQSLRAKIDAVFNDPGSRHFEITNNLFALLTIVSITALVLETVPGLSPYLPLFHAIEYVALAAFSIEYLLRLVCAPHPLKYAFSFFGIIDLLAIVPTYLGFSSLALKSARILRILRFLRLLRLAKLARLTTERMKHKTHDVESLYRINVGIYCLAVLSILIGLGTAMYVAEGHTDAFASIPLGMLWALEIMVDSNGAAKPYSIAGATIETLGRFMSFVLLGFLIHIVGGYVNTLLLGTKKSHRSSALSGQDL